MPYYSTIKRHQLLSNSILVKVRTGKVHLYSETQISGGLGQEVEGGNCKGERELFGGADDLVP